MVRNYKYLLCMLFATSRKKQPNVTPYCALEVKFLESENNVLMETVDGSVAGGKAQLHGA